MSLNGDDENWHIHTIGAKLYWTQHKFVLRFINSPAGGRCHCGLLRPVPLSEWTILTGWRMHTSNWSSIFEDDINLGISISRQLALAKQRGEITPQYHFFKFVWCHNTEFEWPSLPTHNVYNNFRFITFCNMVLLRLGHRYVIAYFALCGT